MSAADRGQCLLAGILESGDRQVTHDEVARWAADVRRMTADEGGPMKCVEVPLESIIEPQDWE